MMFGLKKAQRNAPAALAEELLPVKVPVVV
jgi:hypothetical protein